MGYYSDGSTKQEYKYSLSGFDSSVAGDIEITVDVDKIITSFLVLIQETTVLDSIQVTAYPEKTTFQVGESFNPTGLIVMGNFSDGSAQQVFDYTLSAVDTSVAGVKTVTVTASEKIATFTVRVIDSNVRLASIALDTTSVKTDYQYGDVLDLSGLIVIGTYTDGSDATIPVYEWNTEPLNGSTMTVTGVNPVIITVENCSAKFDVTVTSSMSVNLNIGLNNKEVVIYGIPSGQENNILIYWNKRPVGSQFAGGNQSKPHEITISASEDYSDISWYIDDQLYNYDAFGMNVNIITIKAEDYALDIPHNITFIGKIDGVRYSKTLTFTVIKQGDLQ